tara:strand:+ start:772 stop:879 length:108 start_codon:yes stop_codon:yes gene_type:complete
MLGTLSGTRFKFGRWADTVLKYRAINGADETIPDV